MDNYSWNNQNDWEVDLDENNSSNMQMNGMGRNAGNRYGNTSNSNNNGNMGDSMRRQIEMVTQEMQYNADQVTDGYTDANPQEFGQRGDVLAFGGQAFNNMPPRRKQKWFGASTQSSKFWIVMTILIGLLLLIIGVSIKNAGDDEPANDDHRNTLTPTEANNEDITVSQPFHPDEGNENTEPPVTTEDEQPSSPTDAPDAVADTKVETTPPASVKSPTEAPEETPKNETTTASQQTKQSEDEDNETKIAVDAEADGEDDSEGNDPVETAITPDADADADAKIATPTESAKSPVDPTNSPQSNVTAAAEAA